MQTLVNQRGQTDIPSDILKKYHLEEGDQLLWLEDKDSIKIILVPKDPIKALGGRGKGEMLTEKLLATR
jgi:bifunctional DNA-binding transcriptional regulator/antitoxin component of YhaV-PrlF toxin-antitoxin module